MPDAELAAVEALMLAAAREATAVGLGFARNGAKSWTKGDSSPVTEADLAIDRLLHQRLMTARPDFGWLSEETADSAERLGRDTVFVVDPIDGTRAFINGQDDWTISLALVHRGEPVVAVLAEPAAGRMLRAVRGRGAYCDDQPLKVGTRSALRGARASGAKFAMEVMRSLGADEQPKVFSLALRIAKVALGELDLALAHSGSHDWDLAAADLIVAEAGGRLASPEGKAPRYNEPKPRHGPLIAGNAALLAALKPHLDLFSPRSHPKAH